MFNRIRDSFSIEPIQLPGRAAGMLGWLPLRFNQAPVAQPHEDGIKRSRAEANLLGKLISVLPSDTLRQQSCEKPSGLGRWGSASCHALSLHMSQ